MLLFIGGRYQHAGQACRAASTTVAVTCCYAAKVMIYNCRIR